MQEKKDSGFGKSDCGSERADGLTNALWFGERALPPYATLTITTRWQERAGNLYIMLTDTNGVLGKEFSLGWLCRYAGFSYLVLRLPPSVAAEIDVPPRMIVRVVDQNTVVTIADDEFDRVAVRASLEMEKDAITAAVAIVAELLGSFPSWDEVKDIVLQPRTV